MRKVLNTVLQPLGYQLRKVRGEVDAAQGFAIYRYLKPDGAFDYEAYRRTQTDGNRRKIDQVWVLEENIRFLAEYVARVVSSPRFGLCHGTRRGLEQEWFRKHLGCAVLGTEISDTATQFPHTIQWDFHEVKPEWIGGVDFIYSNSFDHSYDPEKCLNAWMSCVRTGGVCLLEHTSGHDATKANELDPFGADLVAMPYLILNWSKGKFGVREILDAPMKREGLAHQKFIVVQRW